MIRTLIFGAIAGYVGKKLYDEGKLTEFKDDLVTRYNQVREDISARSAHSADKTPSPVMTAPSPQPTQGTPAVG
jgi:hypothetical protein